MQTIYLNRADVAAQMPAKRIGDYQETVIERGHIPGTLSGASIKGRAKQYGPRYQHSREVVASVVRVVTGGRVTDGYDARGRRVWIDRPTGYPVELTLTEEEVEA